MKEFNFEAMVQTATSKYTKLVDSMYNSDKNSKEDFDRSMGMIRSIYQDEISLIAQLYDIDIEKKEKEKKKVLKIPSFMAR